MIILYESEVNCVLQEDESLRRWKEKLLGSLESDLDGLFKDLSLFVALYNNNDFRLGLFKLFFFPLIGQLDPEVKFHSIGILSEDFGEIVTPLPVEENQNGRTLFTLREGSRYQLKLQFSVMHNLVSGLTYLNTVWKGGLQGTHLLLFFLFLLLIKLVYIGFL